MSAYELLQIAVSLSNRLDTHWTLFITVHLALIGGIIYVDRPLFKSEKVVAILIYTGFALINYLMMNNQVTFLNNVYQDIIAMSDQACCQNSNTIAYLSKMTAFGSLKSAFWSIATIHAVMYLIVVASILNDKARGQAVKQDASVNENK